MKVLPLSHVELEVVVHPSPKNLLFIIKKTKIGWR